MSSAGDSEALDVQVDLSRPLRLDAFLKLSGVAPTGGIAKRMIQEGMVSVNGVSEKHRTAKLQAGDVVLVEGTSSPIRVCAENEAPPGH